MEIKKISDEQLVEIIRSKNQEMFAELVKRYQNKLFFYINRLINDRIEAEDLTQDVFIKIYKNLNGFDISKKFSSWAYRIAHNESVNYLKKKSYFKVLSIDQNEFLMNTLSSNENLIEKIIKNERIEILEKLLKKLSFGHREVVVLRYFEEKSYEEISEILRKPVNTIGTMLNRARGQLIDIAQKEGFLS